MQKNKYSTRDSSFAFILTLVVPYVLLFLILTIAGFFTDIKNIGNTTFYKILTLTLSQVSFLLIYFFITKTGKTNFKTSLPHKKINFKQILILLLISLCCLFLISPIVNVYDEFLISLGLNEMTLPLELNSPLNFFILLLTTGILAPISEELVFRGVIFSGLREKNNKTAVLISSLMFMLVHMSLHQTFYQFLLGIILALIVLYTDNIISAIIVHFVNNSLVLLINYISPSFFDYRFLSTNYIIIAIVLLLLGIFIIALLLNYLKKIQDKNKSKEKINELNKLNAVNQNDLRNLSQNSTKKSNMLLFSIIAGAVLWVVTIVLSI